MTLAAWLALGFVALLAAAGFVVARRRERQFEQLLSAADRKLEHLQRQFERFVPADVVERLTEQAAQVAPERRMATMLFADLRGFTPLCDRLDPAVTVQVLNEYFQRMHEAVARHHGHINELIGDGLLALFGALEPNPWQARDAVLAALDMRTELARYNAELRARDLPELAFGIGIHCGEVIAGVMGAGALNKFSVTGDPINVASRVEGLTRDLGVDILVTDEIRRALDTTFLLQPMPILPVKGKSEPIPTYHVRGSASGQAESATRGS